MKERPPRRCRFNSSAAKTRAIFGVTGGTERALVATQPGWAVRAMGRAATPPAFRLFVALLARRFGEEFADRQQQKESVRASQLDWTILKPPRLANSPPTGRVRKGTGFRVELLSKLSRADLAAAILDELEQPRCLHQAVFLKSA